LAGAPLLVQAPPYRPCKTLEDCLRVGRQFTIQDPSLVQQAMRCVFAECLLIITACPSHDEVMARVHIQNGFGANVS
jgi:hypothetical protein